MSIRWWWMAEPTPDPWGERMPRTVGLRGAVAVLVAVTRAAALGATATIFAEYCGYFVPLTPAQVRRVAAVAIVVIGAMNYIGVRRAAAVMSVATVAKYTAVMALGLLALSATTAAS